MTAVCCFNCGGILEERNFKKEPLRALVHCPGCDQYYIIQKIEYTPFIQEVEN